jgi:hypothetical protein
LRGGEREKRGIERRHSLFVLVRSIRQLIAIGKSFITSFLPRIPVRGKLQQESRTLGNPILDPRFRGDDIDI